MIKVILTMCVNRQLSDGTFDHDGVINKAQCYITTAGYINTFAYEKLVEIFIRQLIDPSSAMIMGGTYRIPVYEGLQDKNFIQELKVSGTYDESSFEREFLSIWSGNAEGAFFSIEAFDKNRKLNVPEWEANIKRGKDWYYVIGMDVGRFGCTSEVCIFKVLPQTQGQDVKELINLYSFDEEDFEVQAIKIKQLYYKYLPRAISIDGNGIGAGLIDFLIKTQTDPETGETLPPFGISNDKDGKYKKYITPDTVQDILYVIKANQAINTEIYTYVQSTFLSGKIKLLINYSDAKNKILSTKAGQALSRDERESILVPFRLTDNLKDQMCNLISKNEGINIILTRQSANVPKDRFSALGYGLYYIKQEEERRNKRKTRDLSKLMLFS